MSTQNSAIWFNPSSDRLESGGLGTILSRVPTAQRLASSLSAADAGLISYDPVLKTYWGWNGAAWADMANQLVDVRAYGAVGDGATNDTAAVVLAIAAANSSRKQLYFPSGYTFRLDSRSGPGSADLVSVPDGMIIRIDGTIIGSQGQVISFSCQGSSYWWGSGLININQGFDYRFIQFQSGYQHFRGLRFKGPGSSGNAPWMITCVDPNAAATVNQVLIQDCVCEGAGYFYNRQGLQTSPQVVYQTLISACEIKSTYGGCGISINDVNGLDTDILILGNLIANTQGCGIAVAGQGVLPFDPTVANTCARAIVIAGNEVNTCGSGIHVEYCSQGLITANRVKGVNAAQYPGTIPESNGIVLFGCDTFSVLNNDVADVTGDTIYSYGIQVAGGFYGGSYQQACRNITVANNRLRNASYLIDNQVRVTASGSVPAYELTTSSILDFTGNVSENGVALLFTVATANIRGNTLTAPLSFGPISVVSYARNVNVATLTLTLQNGLAGIRVSDTVKISGVGAGFDTQFATITSVSYISSTQATITYSNTGANVGTTACTGNAYNMLSALVIDCSDTATGNTAFNSVNRLALTIENNRAATTYGFSSFSLRNVSTATRFAANVQMHATGNNFGVSTSYWPVTPINRLMYTAAGSQPYAVEYVLGDQVSVNIGGGGAHTNYICNFPGYLGPAGDTYSIVSATGGTVSRAGATSWLGSTPAYDYGELVKLTNGANSIVGLVQRLSGTVGVGTEIMSLVDPALGTALDLTVLGGAGTIAPYSVATFVTF